MTDAVAVAMSIASRQDLVEYLTSLSARARAGEARVENPLSVDLIEAGAYWAEGIDEFVSKRGACVEDLSGWALVAMVISAGLVYE
jgi:hypothetical protein